MTVRHLLYLTNRRLSAYVWQRGKIRLAGSFTATDSGLAAFTAYLQAHRHRTFRLLADVRDESHQVETIPYLRGGDRRALLDRKLRQRFFSTPLAAAFSLGHEKDRRKNERVLLSALTEPADLDPWLACLAAAATPLAGIHTLSQLGGRLLDRLGGGHGPYLLLTRQHHSIRESFINQGEILFSRQVPLAGADAEEEAQAFAGEAAKLRQYLVGQGQVDSQTLLPAFILAPPDITAALAASPGEPPGLSYTFLDPLAVAASLGMEALPDARHGELVFLHLLALAPPRGQFATADMRRHYRHRQATRILYGATATFALTALAFAGMGFYDSRDYRRQALELLAQEKELGRRHAELAADLPQLAENHETLRRIGSRFSELQRARHQPAEAYRRISRALAPTPAIELASLDWHLTPAGAGWEETVEIHGSINLEGSATPRQILATFGNFTRHLEEEGAYQISVRQPPVDAARSAALPVDGQPSRAFVVLAKRSLPS